MIKDVLRLALTLTLVCLVASASLGLTYVETKKQIEIQQIKEERKALRKVLPQVKSTKDFKERKDLVEALRKEFEDLNKIFDGYVDGQKVGLALQMMPRGYGGFITMVVGLDREGKVIGTSIVSHAETPGLGAGIEESSWLRQFKGKMVKDPLEVNKDIDAISGATKSSRAVTKGVKEALQVLEKIGR